MSPAPIPEPPGDPAPRAEHDALAARLAVRRSIDEVRSALYRIFFGLIAVGLTVKLGWDRYGEMPPGVAPASRAGPPLFLWIATAGAIVLLVLAIRAFARARRLMREEDALYARYRELRRTLELDR